MNLYSLNKKIFSALKMLAASYKENNNNPDIRCGNPLFESLVRVVHETSKCAGYCSCLLVVPL